MASEPINIFSRIGDPAAVVRKMRELCDGVEIDGTEDNWRKAVGRFGRWWKKRTITFNHNPEYYAEPNWSVQMDGMRGFFSRFPDSARKPKVLALTTTFRFSLAVLFDPDFDPAGDPRLNVLCEVAELLDGVLFTPTSLRDAQGHILFSIDGEDDEDEDVIWPRVLASVPVDTPEGTALHEASSPNIGDDEDEAPDPPTALRVARRALALAAVTARAMLESQDKASAHFHDACTKVSNWVKDIGIEDEFEPAEAEFWQAAPGKVDQSALLKSTWRLEGLVVLAWALQRFEIPPHDELVQMNPLWESLGFLDVEKARTLLANPSLRSPSEIRSLRNRLFAIHWRMRNFQLNRQTMDFENFARTCWFGPLDITGLPIVEGDLGIRGHRIDRAPQRDFAETHSASQERHQAVNWLLQGPATYSEASVAT